jgi:hypothetical protein
VIGARSEIKDGLLRQWSAERSIAGSVKEVRTNASDMGEITALKKKQSSFVENNFLICLPSVAFILYFPPKGS